MLIIIVIFLTQFTLVGPYHKSGAIFTGQWAAVELWLGR